MVKLDKLVVATVLMASSPAFASGVVPQAVPEPGLFGIVAAGIAAVVFAARLRNRK